MDVWDSKPMEKKQNKSKFEETDISNPEQQRKDEVVQVYISEGMQQYDVIGVMTSFALKYYPCCL